MCRRGGHPAGRHLLAAHRPDAMEEAGGRRHGHQRGALRATAGLAEDGDVAGVAAKRRGIVAHPAQREDQVQHPDVAGVGEVGAAERRQVEMTERVQPVIDGDDHHVAATRKPRAVGFDPVAGVAGERAGVEPHQHRPAGAVGQARRPHVHVQAVFAQHPVAAGRLRRDGSERRGVADARPRLRCNWRQEATRGRVGSVADALERGDAVVQVSADAAAGRDRDGRVLCRPPTGPERQHLLAARRQGRSRRRSAANGERLVESSV